MKNQTNTTRTITEGINGSGHKIWVVITERGTKVLGVERFTTEAEAQSWIRWA